MSCILRISGENFDVDAFILKSQIVPYKTFYKGSPRLKTKPDGEKNKYSGCAIEVSKAEFNDYEQQVTDAIIYLTDNKDKFQYISSTTEIQHSVLDFGIGYDINKFTQTHHVPVELLRIVADLGISIELSIYQPTD